MPDRWCIRCYSYKWRQACIPFGNFPRLILPTIVGKDKKKRILFTRQSLPDARNSVATSVWIQGYCGLVPFSALRLLLKYWVSLSRVCRILLFNCTNFCHSFLPVVHIAEIFLFFTLTLATNVLSLPIRTTPIPQVSLFSLSLSLFSSPP